jgi:membrane-associated protease RseP (regulator of RpoE activity)
MKRQFATLILFLLLLAGCAGSLRRPSGPGTEVISQPSPQAGYEAEPGRSAATIAQMRVAPAPAVPTLEFGGASANEESRLAGLGYVKIGTSRYPVGLIDRRNEPEARDMALRQGSDVGAERVLLFPPRGDDAAAWTALYYVRFKLPFGATFRDLRAQERAQLGRDGGVEIGTVIGGTPASRANLIAGDFVLEVDGKPVANRAAFQNLLKGSAGRAVTLTVMRNGETLKRVVRLGAIPAADR